MKEVNDIRYFGELDYDPFGMLMVGRNQELGIGYKYGFNGMEKVLELHQSGNIYMVEYRGYDSRIGRWSSIDPIYKSYISNYSGFSNSPITRVDPRGDDDYFDIDGNYVGSDGASTNNIWVLKSNKLQASNDFYSIQKDGSKLVNPKFQNEEYAFKPSDFYYKENKSDPSNGGTNAKEIAYNNYRLKKILGHYFVEPIIEGSRDGDAGAYFDTGDDKFHYAVHNDGKISSVLYNNADNLKSVICDHEDLHKEDYKDPNFVQSYKRHADIYLNQIEASGFTKTTDEFQQSTIIGAVDRYFTAFSSYEDLTKAIINVNNALEAQGVKYRVVGVSYLGAGGYKIQNVETKSVTKTHYVEEIKSPSD